MPWHTQIAHRDIKPENILLTDDMRVRVADFGAARPSARAGAWSHYVATRWWVSVTLTSHYLATRWEGGGSHYGVS